MPGYYKKHVTGNSPDNHCASVCPCEGGVLVAYYTGAECTDLQRVCVEYWVDGGKKDKVLFNSKTGNPVLWNNGDHSVLLLSSFEDIDEYGSRPNYPVDRWMFCSNSTCEIYIDGGKIRLKNMCPLDLGVGFLGRCQPAFIGNRTLLPIYKEHDCYGLIMDVTDNNCWEELGEIGRDPKVENGRFGNGILIQPTIWFDGETLHSLSRSVSREDNHAWYSSSDDFGYDWSEPIPSKIWNANNSIVVIDNGTPEPLVVWNDVPRGRHVLSLGLYDKKHKKAKRIMKLNKTDSASYPNYCVDVRGRIHIVHTDGGAIVRHIMDVEYIESLM